MRYSIETGEPLNPLQSLIGEYCGLVTETQILHMAEIRVRNTLPLCVLEVLKGGDKTDDYYLWLIAEYERIEGNLLS